MSDEKPMTELLRKSGIIDKHIREFEKWRIINEDGFFAETKSADQMVGDLVKEISELLDQEPVMRQTLVAPVYIREPPRLWYSLEETFHAVKDEMGRLIVIPDVAVVLGETVWTDPDINFTVTEIDNIYENKYVVAKMLTIEKEK